MKKIIVTIIYLGFIVSCATTEHDKQRFSMYDDYIVNYDLRSIGKIRNFQFRNWKSLDNKHLILSGSHKKQYVLTLLSYCLDLEFSVSIGLKQSINSILSASFDSIIVATQPNQQCRIKSIHELSRDQEKELLTLKKNLRNSK